MSQFFISHSPCSLWILQVAAGPTPVACGHMEPPAVFRMLTLPRLTLSCYQLPQKNRWEGLPLSKQQLSRCETYVCQDAPQHSVRGLSSSARKRCWRMLVSCLCALLLSVTSLGPGCARGWFHVGFYGRVRRLHPLLSFSSAVRWDSSRCEYGDACSLALIITSAQLLRTITSGNWPVIVAAFPRWW